MRKAIPLSPTDRKTLQRALKISPLLPSSASAAAAVANLEALAGTYTITNPSALRSLNVAACTLNEVARVLATLLTDLGGA